MVKNARLLGSMDANMDYDTTEITWRRPKSENLRVVGYIGEERVCNLSFRADFRDPDGSWTATFSGGLISLRWPAYSTLGKFDSLSEGIKAVEELIQANQVDIWRIQTAENQAKAELDNLND